jgi:hypothetical protein
LRDLYRPHFIVKMMKCGRLGGMHTGFGGEVPWKRLLGMK